MKTNQIYDVRSKVIETEATFTKTEVSIYLSIYPAQ